MYTNVLVLMYIPNMIYSIFYQTICASYPSIYNKIRNSYKFYTVVLHINFIFMKSIKIDLIRSRINLLVFFITNHNRLNHNEFKIF